MKKNSRANKRLTALSLRYDAKKDKAPRLTAKGRGAVAEEILRIARENSIPIKEDPDLVELLYPLEFDQEIPPELYGVVAELLAYIYRLNRKAAST